MSYNAEYYQKNKDKIREWTKDYRKKYREEHKEEIKKYREEHKDYMKKYREEHKEEIKKYREDHKKEINEYKQKWYEEHKEEIKKYREEHKEEIKKYREEHKDDMKKYNIMRLYGLTMSEYNALLLQQGYRCAICKKPLDLENRKHVNIDHDHVTQRVRGILCHHCNSLLGRAFDDPDILQNAQDYILAHSNTLFVITKRD